MRRLAKEQENEEDKAFKKYTSEIIDTNELKISKDRTVKALISSQLSEQILLEL